MDPDGRITRDEYAYQLRTEGYEYKADIIEKQAAKDNQGFNIRIFKEFRDVFSIEVKVGLGLDLEVIENIGIDLGSLQGIISSSGFTENFTVGIGYGPVSLSDSASTDTDRAMIYELPENGNKCVSIGPFTYSMEDGFDFELSVGFQAVVGLYFHFSGKEFLDLVMKVEDIKHEY